MSGSLHVHTDGLRQFSQTHADIAAGVTQLAGRAPTAAGVGTTHGSIAMAVQSALSDLLGSRTGTLQKTATSGDTISGLLTKAAQMYDDGDRDGAAKVRAIAEAMSNPRDGRDGPPPGLVGPMIGGVLGEGVTGPGSGETTAPPPTPT